jgi:hypothetical protein
MTGARPLSCALSQVLVAFTIELDNEFERRMAETGVGRRFGISLVMWSNFLRFVGEGILVKELPDAAGLPKARVLSVVGGMERWRYVTVGPQTAEKRDGYGSKRGLHADWVIRRAEAGVAADEIWSALLHEIERSWETRFGKDTVPGLRRALAAILEQVPIDLPDYLPIVVAANGMTAEIVEREREGVPPAHLSALLSQVLLAYTLDFERESELSLPLGENFVRVLDGKEIAVRDIPLAAGVSPEATAMALRSLTKTGHVVVESKVARLTENGRRAHAADRALQRDLERRWEKRFGERTVADVRAALDRVLAQPDELSSGLEPPPDGWRMTKRYVEQTMAVLDDPIGRLPHYPMVLPRGGWPDGS